MLIELVLIYRFNQQFIDLIEMVGLGYLALFKADSIHLIKPEIAEEVKRNAGFITCDSVGYRAMEGLENEALNPPEATSR